MLPDAKYDVIVLLAIHKLGGAELSLLSIADGLRKNGFNVMVAAFGRRCDLAKETMPDLPIHELHCQSSLKALLPLTQLLKKTRSRVLISGLRVPNIIAMFASRFADTGIRAILTEHTPREAQSAGIKQQFIRQLMDNLYQRADAVVAVSRGIQKGLSVLIKPERLHVIHNPVVKENSVLLPPAHAWLKPGAPPVIMGIGRLSAEKNFALLLKAFTAISATRPMRLIILGEGAERAALESMARELGIADKFLLPGFQNIAGWLPHAKLFVSPSLYEGFGNAIVEALHYRVPVIATDCPVGPDEILENGSYGTLVANDNVHELKAAILAALEKPKFDNDNGYERARHFSENNCITAYSALIRQMVSL